MSSELFVLTLIGLVIAVYAGIALRTYFRVRGRRVVVCPETHEAVAVKVDAAHAAATAMWEQPDIQLKTCSRWPDRPGCDQACTEQIAESPEETLAFNIARKGFAEKLCAICNREVPALHHGGPQPGLMNAASPRHEIVSWDEMPPEALPEAFETHLPVCANCVVAESFRRKFPDLAIDRPEHPNVGASIH